MAGCANQQNEPDINPVAGGASDTETAMVQGFVSCEANIFGASIILYLFNMDSIPNASMPEMLAAAVFDTVDNNGKFEIDLLGTGDYRILAVDDASQYNAFIGPFMVGSTDTSIYLDTARLQLPGVISGTAGSPDTNILICMAVTVFIKGSPYIAYSDTLGQFYLENVPQSAVKLNYYRRQISCSSDTSKARIDTTQYTCDSPVQVPSGSTVNIGNILTY